MNQSFAYSTAEEVSAEADQEDIITKAELDGWLKTQTGRSSQAGKHEKFQSPTSRVPRNFPVEDPFRVLGTYSHNSILLRPGVNVELQDSAFLNAFDRGTFAIEPHNSFLRIVDIIQNSLSQAITLRGHFFQRAQYLKGLLEKKRNEVCWVMHVDDDDSRDIRVQSMETVSVDKVVRRRRIRLTNQPWPKLSFREDIQGLEDLAQTIRNERVLVCRFKYICYYVCAERREMDCWSERVVQRLRNADCDRLSVSGGEPSSLDDTVLREEWRRDTTTGGSFFAKHIASSSERLLDITRNNTIDLTTIDSTTIDSTTIDLTEEICELRKMDYAQSSLLRDSEYPPSVTRFADRVGWNTKIGTEYCTMNSFTASKRNAKVDTTSQPWKRRRVDQFPLKIECPPETISMVPQLRKWCSVYEVAPSVVADTKLHYINSSPSHRGKRQYTFGDSFCGAGGMSRAAEQTGLHIKYAFDCNKNACNTYKLNFPNANLHCLWAHDFVRKNIDCRVDIAHFSPPCQFFSDAHTKVGKDDEMNTASLFAVGELLKKSRPRVVTLEQTFGIVLRARHQGYLSSLIQVFTSHGFSVRWRVLHCADYGLPQMRLRTFIIASW